MDASAPTPAELFALVWRELTEVIGTTATAMLLRRAARTASNGAGEPPLTIAREGFEHTYRVPETWNQSSDASRVTVNKIFCELRPLLVELTGPVLVRRLAASPIADIARAFTIKEEP